jgi:hypothetical protein
MSSEITVSEGGELALPVGSSEIDTQIATAHRFPRNITAFRNAVKNLATLNSDVASECFYAVPREGKNVIGPSARFAEIIASAWGNCRFGARVVATTERFIVAQGYFHDLEQNTAVQFEVQRRITTRKGARYGDDMVATTGNAASSIALRNAVLKGVPKALWQDLWEEARLCASGGSKPLEQRRADALKLFSEMGIKEQRVFEFLGVNSPEDMTVNHLLVLRGLVTAFKEGDATPEEVFPSKQETKPLAQIENAQSVPMVLDELVKKEHQVEAAPIPQNPVGASTELPTPIPVSGQAPATPPLAPASPSSPSSPPKNEPSSPSKPSEKGKKHG